MSIQRASQFLLPYLACHFVLIATISSSTAMAQQSGFTSPRTSLPSWFLAPPSQATASAKTPTSAAKRVRNRDDRIAATSGPKPADPSPPVPSSTLPPIAKDDRPKAVARFEGTAAPGLRIHLVADGSTGSELNYLWIQTKGPEVKLDRADSDRASFIVPAEVTSLTFQLVVAGAAGVDRTTLEVPLELHTRPVLPQVVIADAGDDQVAVVGRRVTLNGIRSKPRDHSAYRWIQIAGPAATQQIDASWTTSFVPIEPGKYRFLLVVASDGAISEPDEVQVSVLGDEPTPSGQQTAASTEKLPALQSIPAAAARLKDDFEANRKLADAFDAVAERMPLYESYDEVFSEIARRIDSALPAASPRRVEWERQVFGPLSARIIQDLRGVALDLSRPQDRARPLNIEQKTHLTGQFRSIAADFRGPANPGTALTENPGIGHSK